MTDDWEKGDLALCVKLPQDADEYLSIGAMYVVNEVFWGWSIYEPDTGGLALNLAGVTYPHPDAHGYGVENFIKVGGRSVEQELSSEVDQSYPIPVKEPA